MRKVLFVPLAVLFQLAALAQAVPDSLLKDVTLQQAVSYSIDHQPLIRQSQLDERITDANIRSRLADWYPQINFFYNLQHNFIVQTSIIGGNPVKLGVDNVSAAQFTATQAIFNRDVLLAVRTRNEVRKQAKQNTSSNKIDIAAEVSKAFYDVLASIQQVKVSGENITRVERSLKDAYYQYQAGVTDKTDFKRATIALNNARAAKKTNEELLKAKLEYLKSVMGYPVSGELNIVYDSLQMEKEAIIDTMQQVDYTKRIEYRLLETQQNLLQANLRYTRWSYLPSIAANGAYNFNYLNNQFTKLYDVNYPNSFAALTFSLPLFQGGKRKADIQAAQFQVRRNGYDIENLRNSVNAEYTAALSNYKGNYSNYTALKDNLALAREVYDVINLQYRNGIKTYLEVINSETDLRTAQINYYDALYNLLASKIDVEKALGQINY